MDQAPHELRRIAETCARHLEQTAVVLEAYDEAVATMLADMVRERTRMQRFLEEFDFAATFGASEELASGGTDAAVAVNVGSDELEDIRQVVQRASALRANVDSALQVVRRCTQQLQGERAFESVLESEDMRLQLAMNTAREQERRRLAREIHDGPAQVLANAIFGVEIAEQMSRRSPENVAEELKGLQLLLRDGVAEVRRFMFDLRPTMLDEQGIVPTLHKYVDDFNRFFGKQVTLETDFTGTPLHADEELALFRTTQEALQNFHKHAGADRASVRLHRSPQRVELVIQDDGAGFDPESVQARTSGGSGLKGMRDRASLIGADLLISSEPGRGTAVRLGIEKRSPSELRK